MRTILYVAIATTFCSLSAAKADEIFRTCGMNSLGFVRVGNQLECIYGRKIVSGSDSSSSQSYSLTTEGNRVYSELSPVPVAGYRPGDMSGNLYGSRGGCYRLNSKGNKDYGKC